MVKLQGNSEKRNKANSHKPRVSIGMPVRNGENFIKEAIDSILAQTFKDFELIISDNASTDKTQEICKAYAAKDKRIRYYRNKKNLGAAYNFNRVFELSRGGYFKWAAHDDVLKPKFIEKCVKVLDSKLPVILCYPKTTIIDEKGKQKKRLESNLNLHSPRPHQRFKQCLKRFRFNLMCNPIFGLMRASNLKQTSLIRNYYASDMILFGELVLIGKFHELPDHLFFRRFHPQRSCIANPSVSERTIWFDPSKKGKLQLPTWRWFKEYLSAIRHVPLSWYERICCYFYMGNWVLWNRKDIIKDISKAIKQVTKINAIKK